VLCAESLTGEHHSNKKTINLSQLFITEFFHLSANVCILIHN
jgi:hypothetical protein